jgi:HD-like signal output (HDOD) protein
MTAQSLAREVKILFSLPEVTLRLNQLLALPQSTNSALGEVIINDPALTARLLKLANNVFDGCASKVDMVSQAIALLGRDALRDLVTAASVTRTFSGIPPELADMERFWFNSVACGLIARSLAFRCRIFNSEPFFVAGLLHKVGRLAFYSYRPDQYRRVLEISDGCEESIHQAERHVFGFTHADLGAELLRNWGLPERLQVAVAHYRAPNRAPNYRRSAALVHVASALAANMEPGVNLDELLSREQAGFDKGAWDILGLSLETVPTIVQDAWIQAFETFETVRPDSVSIH